MNYIRKELYKKKKELSKFFETESHPNEWKFSYILQK